MWRKILLCIVVFGLLGVVWEASSRTYDSLQFMLPAPSKISAVLWEQSGRLSFHTWTTLKEMAGGFALALVFSFPLAWIMALFGPLRTLLQPVFVASQCIPMFALAPIMVLWFGWTYTAIVVPTALMVFFPLTINIYQGLCCTPQNFLDFFRLHQATPWQTFLKLQLPWALPHIFAGFRISVALAGIGAVAGEWAGGQQGLGILMLESRRSADLEMMFAALVCVMVLSMFFYGLASWMENWTDMRHKRKKHLGRLMSMCLMIGYVFVAGCQPSTPRIQETTIVLDWLPNPDHVAIYAGIEKGYFAEQGIALKVIKVADPSDSVPYLTSRQANLALTYMPHTMQVLSKGAPVLPIGVLVQEPLNALIFRAGEGIDKPQDLAGKTFGYSVDGYQTLFLDVLLKNQGVSPKALHNASFDLVGMLATKQVDVVYGAYWNIERENLRAHGIETDFFPLSDFGIPTYFELIVLAHAKSPEAAPEFVAAFQTALQQSIDFSKSHPKEAFEAYLQANPDKSALTRKWEWEAWLKTIPTLATQQQIDPVVWDQFSEWLVANSLIRS